MARTYLLIAGIIAALIVVGIAIYVSMLGTGTGGTSTISSASATASTSPSPETLRGELDFYTSLPKEIAIELVKMFNEKYPNVKINIVRSGTSKLMTKLLAEIKSGRIIADVVWLADPASIEVLKERGVLMKYVPPEARFVPPNLRDKDGYWIAGRVIMPVIAYNTNIVENPPSRWSDLVNESYVATLPAEWRNSRWLAIPNPLYSGAAAVMVYAISSKYGWSFFEELKSNGWLFVEKSNGVVLQGVISGKYPIGITLDYMVRQRKAAGDPIDMVIPQDGAIVIPSPIAIIKDTPYPEAAKAFVRFMLSKEVQEFLASKGFIPARTDVSPPPGAPKLSELKVIEIDWSKLAQVLEDVKKKFEEIVTS